MSKLNNRILLINTGGTFDAVAYANPYNPPKYVETLKGANSLIMPTVRQLPDSDRIDGFSWGGWDEDRFVKDSQAFTPGDIKKLADIIKRDDRRYFILTHGTDAMAKNASMLKKELEGTDKTIIFVGAMLPLSMGTSERPSDGVDALNYAIQHIEEPTSGVYMAARDTHNSRLKFFNPEEVEKNKEASRQRLAFTVNLR